MKCEEGWYMPQQVVESAGEPNLSWTNLARQGAREGALAWMAYWAVESFLLHILPRLTETASGYMPPSAAFTATLLILYTVVGLISGAFWGIALAFIPLPGGAGGHATTTTLRLRSGLALALSAVVISNLWKKLPSGLPAWYFWLFFAPVGLTLLIALFFPARVGHLRMLASPWLVCVTLIVLPSIFVRSHPRPSLVSGAVALLPYLAAALLLAAASVLAPRRVVLATLTVCALLLGACFLLRQHPRRLSGRASVTPPADKPNVILIVLDTVRADHLSLYGYERDTTPNLRKLAAQSTVFTNAISAGDMSLSSHASIFTGLYPSWHQAHFNAPSAASGAPWGQALDSRYPTLAEMLSAKGFDTAAIVANYLYLGAGFGLDRGFAYHDSAAPTVFLQTTSNFLLRERIRNLFSSFEKPWETDVVFRRAEDINIAALQALDEEKNQGRKFFYFLNYMDAHWPYLPPDRFATLYPGSDPHIRTGRYDEIEHEVLTRKHPLSQRERDDLVSQYDGSIAYMDWSLGEFLNQLKQRGLYDNTLLIITSDHGEAFGEKDLVGHALSVYQAMVHVPLLIKYPGQNAPAVSSDTVSLTDLVPTILAVLGYSSPKMIQGKNLRSASAERSSEVLSETFVHPLMSTWTPRFQRSAQALFSGTLKFIQSSNGDKELYDLSADPNEDLNLVARQPTDLFSQTLVHYLSAAAVESRRQKQDQVGSGTIEKLKSLGYIQ